MQIPPGTRVVIDYSGAEDVVAHRNLYSDDDTKIALVNSGWWDADEVTIMVSEDEVNEHVTDLDDLDRGLNGLG